MKNEQEVIEYKVGIFILSGLIILGIVIFLLGGESSIFTEYYQISMKTKHVQGIQNGSVVSVAGMKAGNVTTIKYDESDGQLVLKLRIDRNYEKVIRKDGVASFRTRGALGDRYVYIEPGSINSPPIAPGEVIKTEGASDLFSKLSEKGKQVDQVFEVIAEIKTLLERINGEQRSEKVMKNLVESSEGLKDFASESKKLLLDIRQKLPKNNDLNQSIARLASILKKIDDGQGTLGTIINDPSLHKRLVTLLGGEKRTRHLKSIIRESIQSHENSDKQ